MRRICVQSATPALTTPIANYCGPSDRPGRFICACLTGGDCAATPDCHVSTCVGHVCGATPVADGTSCDVGKVCTAGACGGVDHCTGVVCSPSDQCHLAGVCDPA